MLAVLRLKVRFPAHVIPGRNVQDHRQIAASREDLSARDMALAARTNSRCEGCTGGCLGASGNV